MCCPMCDDEGMDDAQHLRSAESADVITLPDGVRLGPRSWVATTSAGQDVVDAIAAEPQTTLLAMDFDGTLAPIVSDPTQSRILPASRDAIGHIGAALGGCAIITGRPVQAVREMAGLDTDPQLHHLVVLGQYGVERYDVASGKLIVPDDPPQVRRAVSELTERIDQMCVADSRLAGTHVEDKGRAVAVHTRRARDSRAAWRIFAPLCHEVADQHDLHAEEGREVIELKAESIGKDDALRELQEQTHARIIVMCGDDLGDVSAFGVIDEWIRHGGSGARVVSYSVEQPQLASHADILCDGPEGVAAFLDEIARRVATTSE